MKRGSDKENDNYLFWSSGKGSISGQDGNSIGHGVAINASGEEMEESDAAHHGSTLVTNMGSDTKPVIKIVVTDVEPPKLIGDLACLMHLLKGMIGTGILAMPVAYKNGGLWVSLAVVMTIGIVCTHCMHVLVRCSDELCKKSGERNLDYAEVMEKAFYYGGNRWRKYSSLAKYSVNGFLIFTQFGFCAVYNVFVAQNIQQVIGSVQSGHHLDDRLYIVLVMAALVPYTMIRKLKCRLAITNVIESVQSGHHLDGRLYIVMVMAALVPYTMIRNLKIMAPFSAVANVFNCVGVVIVIYGLVQQLPATSVRPAFAGVGTLPLFFGQSMFSFEGIGLILPLYNKMKRKESFLGKAGVVNLGLTISICLYCAVGFYGYLKYGPDVEGSVTLNLDSGNWLFRIVKLMFAVSLFISYGVMFYVPINIIWPFIVYIVDKKFAGSFTLPSWGEYIFRLCWVFIICGMAALVPHLGLLISLVGAFASSFLALIFPAVIELVTYQAAASTLTKVKDTVIIALGLLGFLTGTYSSVKEIVDTF